MSNAGRASVKYYAEKSSRVAETPHSVILRNRVGVAEAGGFPLGSAQAVDLRGVGGEKGRNSPRMSTRPREIPAIIEVWQARNNKGKRIPDIAFPIS